MLSVGIDILEIKRIPLSTSFINRFFTLSEIKKGLASNNEYQKQKYFAGLWALKEAIYKALPAEKLFFKQINIIKIPFGPPTVKINNYHITLSLSHTETTIIAVAVATNYSQKI